MKKALILSVVLNVALGIMGFRIHQNYQTFKHKVIDYIPVKYLDHVKVSDF